LHKLKRTKLARPRRTPATRSLLARLRRRRRLALEDVPPPDGADELLAEVLVIVPQDVELAGVAALEEVACGEAEVVWVVVGNRADAGERLSRCGDDVAAPCLGEDDRLQMRRAQDPGDDVGHLAREGPLAHGVDQGVARLRREALVERDVLEDRDALMHAPRLPVRVVAVVELGSVEAPDERLVEVGDVPRVEEPARLPAVAAVERDEGRHRSMRDPRLQHRLLDVDLQEAEELEVGELCREGRNEVEVDELEGAQCCRDEDGQPGSSRVQSE